MAVGIKIQDNFLELTPNAVVQRQRNSPLFLNKENNIDAIKGEFTFPFQIPITDANSKTLQFSDHLPNQKQNLFSAILHDDNMQVSTGKLIVQNLDTNLQRSNDGYWDAYFLSNVSDFFKRIENKKLKEFTLGGIRTFTFTNFTKATTGGFWQHVYATMSYANCTFGDYVFTPIYNEGYLGGTKNWQVELDWDATAKDWKLNETRNCAALTPSLYLVNILKYVFAESGYTLTGDILEDYDFKQIVLPSFYGVKWATFDIDEDGDFINVTPLTTVEINLQNHVPPSKTVADLIIAVMSFLPVSFVWDDIKKSCRIVTIKNIHTLPRKDITSNVDPAIKLSFPTYNTKPIKYGFNRVIENDTWDRTDLNVLGHYMREVDLTGKTPIVNTGSLGEAIIAGAGPNFHYFEKDGMYIVYNGYSTMNASYGGRIRNYTANGTATNMLNCYLNPLPLFDAMWANLESEYAPQQRFRVPSIFTEGNWTGKETINEWDFRCFFYKGLNYAIRIRDDIANKTPATVALMPFGTTTPFIFPNSGTVNFGAGDHYIAGRSAAPVPDGSWGLDFEGTYGTVTQWWSSILQIYEQNELLKLTYHAPLHQYLQLQYDDVLLIKSTPYLISSIQDELPYNGSVQLELLRVVV